MTHEEAVNGNLAEDYLANRLDESTRSAFEDHFFECDACFAALETEDALARASRELPGAGTDVAAPGRTLFLPWLLAAAAVVLAVAAAGLAHQRVAALEARLASSEARVADLDHRLTDARRDAAAADALRRPEPNVPLAIFQTVRGRETVTLKVPADAARFIVWLEDVPEAAGPRLDLTLSTEDGAPTFVLHGLARNQYGAVVAVFPAAGLNGRYTLTAADPSGPVAAYTLVVAR